MIEREDLPPVLFDHVPDRPSVPLLLAAANAPSEGVVLQVLLGSSHAVEEMLSKLKVEHCVSDFCLLVLRHTELLWAEHGLLQLLLSVAALGS